MLPPIEPSQGPPTAAPGDGLEAILRRFENAWRQGGTPALDHFLPALPEERLPALIELAHIDLEMRLEVGQPARAESYFERYPELADESAAAVSLIAREYDVRRRREPRLDRGEYLLRFPRYRDELLARLPAPAAQPGAPDTVESLSVLLRRGPLLEPEQAVELQNLQVGFREPRDLARELLKRNWLTAFQVNQLFQGKSQELTLGPYLLLERLGQGGMGQVFKARHRLMKRTVALKLIRKDRLASDEAVRRFHREMRSLGQVSHPNIVIAHDAACINDVHFLVMEYVEGTDLAKLLQKRGPLPVGQACDYVRQAALGLQHAYEKGMVHRDIKPANLMVTPEGVVKILDMGLARLRMAAHDQTAPDLTQEGMVMGTPDYIAPEQAEESRDVDIRADIYSLGCTLYSLLSGHAPFPDGTALQKIVKHQQARPAPLSAVRHDVPAGLVPVLDRMMAKRPEDRYSTPAAAALALEVFCSGRVPVAIPLSLAERQGITAPPPHARFAESEQQTEAGLTAPMAIPLGAAAPATEKKPERPWRVRPRWLAVAGGAAALLLVLGLLARWGGPKPPVTDNRTVLQQLSTADIPEWNRPEWGPKDNPPDVVAVLGEHRVYGSANTLALSPDGDRVAVGMADRVVLGDARTLRKLREFPMQGHALSAAFSHDGKWLAGGSANGVIWVWKLPEGNEPRRLEGHKGSVYGLAYTPEGQLLSASTDQTVGVWSLEKKDPVLHRFTKHTMPVMCVAVSPDGKRAVSGSSLARAGAGAKAPAGGSLQLWDIKTREVIRSFAEVSSRYDKVAFSPDGSTIVTADGSNLRWWTPGEDKPHRQSAASGGLTGQALEFSKDGGHLLFSTYTGSLDWLDARDGMLRRRLPSIDALAAPLPDGKRILSMDNLGLLRGLDAETGKEERPLTGHVGAVKNVWFSADDKRVFSSGSDKRLRLWGLEDRKDLRHFPSLEYMHYVLAPSRRWVLAWKDAPGSVPALLDVRRATKDRDLPGHIDIRFAAFLGPNEVALTIGHDGIAREWDLDTGEKQAEWKVRPKGAFPFAVSPDGKQLLCKDPANGALYLCERGNAARERAIGVGGCTVAAFSAGGEKIYFGRGDGVVGWIAANDPKAEVVTYQRYHDYSVNVLAISPDGERLASADSTGRTVVWDTTDRRRPLRRMWDQAEAVNGMAFASDSRHLATANGNGTIYILRLK